MIPQFNFKILEKLNRLTLIDTHLPIQSFRTGYKHGNIQFACHKYNIYNKMGVSSLIYLDKRDIICSHHHPI